jgi:hypothetical protein
MFLGALLISLASGGLAGGCVSTVANRHFYRRALRTKFCPLVLNMTAAYAVRFEAPEGQYWSGTVGEVPSPNDREFVTQRAKFISQLIEFNELEEARTLRSTLIGLPLLDTYRDGNTFRRDLLPEYDALHKCTGIVHKKLKLT